MRSSLYPVSTDKQLLRLGPTGDGGYLIPDDLSGITACYSPGVSSESGFEKDCADRGIKVYLADASVSKPPQEHPLFEFSRVFIGGKTRGNFITLDQWVRQTTPDCSSDLMLQMDIEGYEYEALHNVSTALLKRFRIIVIEFHGLDVLSSYRTGVLRKLTRTHQCVHIHPNNCCGSRKVFNLKLPKVMEFTFLRKDRINESAYRNDFPHTLDADNTVKPPLPLPACWYRHK